MAKAVYKIMENGKADNWHVARKCPKGYKSIDSDVIPEDITPYHKKKYIVALALEKQEKILLELISSNEYHLVSKRKKMKADRETWEDMLDTWDDELTIVQDQIELLKEGKDPGEPIKITPKPVLNGD